MLRQQLATHLQITAIMYAVPPLTPALLTMSVVSSAIPSKGWTFQYCSIPRCLKLFPLMVRPSRLTGQEIYYENYTLAIKRMEIGATTQQTQGLFYRVFGWLLVPQLEGQWTSTFIRIVATLVFLVLFLPLIPEC
jgi:hypothetical protein